MITVESRKERKRQKAQMRLKMRSVCITMRDIELRLQEDVAMGIRAGGYHYNTIKMAFNPDNYYWNQDLINLANNMITEKKQLSTP